MISLKQIHYALAVEKSLHFKKAAELCHVSQSALSSAISEMEAQLGGQIFERNNKHVFVTSFGQKVLCRARDIKLQLDDLMLMAQSEGVPLTSAMSIGVIPTIGPYLLPKVLPEVRRCYPEFPLKIVEDQSHNLVEMVKDGELDTAILALPYDTAGLNCFTFWQEDFYYVSHKDSCPKNNAGITSHEIELDHLLLLKEGHCLKDHAIAACQLKSQSQKPEFDSTSLHTIIQMVVGQMGSTLVPEMALSQLIHDESELKAIHLDEPGPHRQIAFIARPNYVRTSDIETLMALFKKQLKAVAH